MHHNQKLELSWMGKGDDLNLEPRIMQLQPEHCFGDAHAENMLIHGDNLLALKALEQEYAGKIKCIYIDPPYNTGNAFEHYDDMQEHSLWLNLMYHRLVLLKNLLHTEGSIWISIDDDECHYLKVMMDEVFGRSSFIASNVWQKRYSRENREAIGDAHEYLLVYAKDARLFKNIRNKIPLGDKQLGQFSNPNNDPNGPWQSVSLTAQGFRPNQMYPITGPTGKKHLPPEGSCWKLIESNYLKLLEEGRIYFGKDGMGVPRRIYYLKDSDGIVPWTWWNHEEVGHTDEAKKEIHNLFGKIDAFATPKPERLVKRILEIATKEGDIVLDSFLGSGTTAAVAHKMGRQWIGIELGNHAYTHCLPRLSKVVDGSDQGGISKAMNWTGGGGFKVYKLAESLLEYDEKGILHVNPDFTDEMVAEAVAKIEGYRYNPTPSVFWQQAEGLDKSYLYVTKIFISRQWLD